MEWRDEGVLLAVRPHGETAAIIEMFTPKQGRHVGVVRGGTSRRMTPVLQPGAQLDVTWRARLQDHLGAFTVEPVKTRAAEALSDRLALAGLASVCALLSFTLPEREPHPALYARSVALLDGLGAENWARAYLGWEMGLLEEAGFALDLTSCAVTGSYDDLVYVSPRTGRAVSRAAAGAWADRLLPLPECLLGQGPADARQIDDGLRLTGHFLAHHLAPSLGEKPLPAARQRLIDLIVRQSAS
ncbi:DNA repair protein RecO [Rhodophyticola sp. CCM32]|uniref:DNA repair protein RecO n=1 Tax=Rhodophyticola sp. CCM32 TaxID=2916397 RepID=UPI00107F69A1|nr:DNA repair protein RecO [Rhodophyticola sp. CCM32]QBY02841.1 DNA repair protein RecO [Rhodophyticola sp. CCM32]